MVGGGGADQHFPIELGAAIDVDWAGRVILAIGVGRLAVEHIIGRQLDHRSADRVSARGDFASARGIDPLGQCGIAFGGIDRGQCGGVDDQVRASGGNDSFGAARVSQIEQRSHREFHLDARNAACRFGERPRHLTRRAGHQYSHLRAPSRAPSYRPSRSGRHHHSLARNQSMVCASPVSKS